MKALERVKRQAKRAREDNELADSVINSTAEFLLLSMALELNEKDGYGQKRVEDRWRGLLGRCTDMVERYGADCAVFAMKEKAMERGFEIEITQGKKLRLRLKEDENG